MPTTAPIPLATYLASLTMNFYDLANVRATGDAVIQVVGGNGSVSIPVAQGVQGFSVYGGTTVPAAASPVGAVTMDQYIYAGTGATTPLVVNPGDILRKAGDGTWSVIGSVRGAVGPVSTVPGPPGPLTVTERGTWLPNTSYPSGSVVTQQGFRWLCVTSHTSVATFTNTNWVQVGHAPKQVQRSEWYYPPGSGSLAVGEIENPLPYTEVGGNNAPAAWTSGSGFTLQAAGLWSIYMSGSSDGPNPHVGYMGLRWNSGPFTERLDREYTGGGFAGGGAVIHTVSYVGVVSASQLSIPIRDVIGHQSAGGSLSFGNRVTLEYLGA